MPNFGGQNLQSPSPSRSKQSFWLWIFVISMCSKTVGVFDCKPANVANDIGVVVVDAIAAADGKFAGKIVALLD